MHTFGTNCQKNQVEPSKARQEGRARGMKHPSERRPTDDQLGDDHEHEGSALN